VNRSFRCTVQSTAAGRIGQTTDSALSVVATAFRPDHEHVQIRRHNTTARTVEVTPTSASRARRFTTAPWTAGGRRGATTGSVRPPVAAAERATERDPARIQARNMGAQSVRDMQRRVGSARRRSTVRWTEAGPIGVILDSARQAADQEQCCKIQIII
jgi:hypothetical protein